MNQTTNTRTIRRRPWRVVIHLLTVLIMAVGGLIALPATAQAASYNVGQWGTWNGARTFWGVIVIGGRNGFCLDPGLAPPTVLNDATAKKICGGTDSSGAPNAAAQMAYLTAKYAGTKDNQIATSISQFDRAQYRSGIPVTYPSVYNKLVAEAKRNAGRHDALVQVDLDNSQVWYGLVRLGEKDRTKAHYADGFTATLTITSGNATFDNGTTTLTVTTSTTAKAAPITMDEPLGVDEPVAVSISIPNVPSHCYMVHAGGSVQRVVTGLRVTVTGSDSDSSGWMPTITTLIDKPNLTTGATSLVDKVMVEPADGTQWPVLEWADDAHMQPKTYVPLVASGQIAKTNAAPEESSSILPDDAKILPGDKIQVTLTGPGVWATSQVPLPADPGAGHYSIRWCLDPADQTGDNAKYLPADDPVCDDWFAADERFTLPMRIEIATTVPDKFHPKGEAPDDTITLSLPDQADQWISDQAGKPVVVKAQGTYYAGTKSTFTPADTVPADAKILGTATVDITLPTGGRDPVTVPAPAGFTVPTSQYGVWVWRIDKAAQAEATKPLIAESVTDRFGQTEETHVTRMDLTILSQVVDAAITEPTGSQTGQVCDQVWVEHATPGDLWLNQWGTSKPVQVLITGTIYHSAVPAAQTLDPGDVPSVDSFELTFTGAGQDNAQTVCHSITYGQYGAYGFQWTLKPDNQPAATKDYLTSSVTTPLWLPDETTIVKRTPVIHTAATSWDTTTGGVVTTYFQDDIWQTDWPDNPDDTNMHGATGHGDWKGLDPWQADGQTITVELWKITGDIITRNSCTTENPNATLVATNTVTSAVNTWAAAQKVSGSRFKADGDATYTFIVSWPGDGRTEPYRSICGEKSETITIVSGTPQFVTQLVTPADADSSTVDAAQAQQAGITIQPGQDLVDVLHVWADKLNGRVTPMTGWQATWQAYFVPANPNSDDAKIVQDDSGVKVYSDALCTPDTLYWESTEPVPVEAPGSIISPTFTAPDQSGSLFLVETVTDMSDQDHSKVVRHGVCGAVSESGIIPTPTPPELVAQTGGSIQGTPGLLAGWLVGGLLLAGAGLTGVLVIRRHRHANG